jgi:hypothetical protein
LATYLALTWSFFMRLATLGLAVAAATAVFATAAEARCTRLGFSVNDYGKVGPTNDAKNLLDKYVATWAAANGIKKYTTGKKDVTCELYIDLIIFDEYTCRAEANVCWDGPAATVTPSEASVAPAKAAPKAAPKAPAAKEKAAASQ